MRSSYHPLASLASWLRPEKPAPKPPARDAQGRRLPPYYLPGFAPPQTPGLHSLIEEIVEAAASSLDAQKPQAQITSMPVSATEPVDQADPGLQTDGPKPDPQMELDGFHELGEIIAFEAARLLHHLRAGEWRGSGAYQASIHVLSYEIFSDASGELLARTSSLVSRLEGQGLVKIIPSDASESGFACVRLRPKGRMLADRTLSPLVPGA